MGRLEELTKGARVRGVAPIGVVTVIDAEWIGSDAVNLTYEDDTGNVEREIVYRSKESELSLDGEGRPWSFDADPELFTLVAEVKRPGNLGEHRRYGPASRNHLSRVGKTRLT